MCVSSRAEGLLKSLLSSECARSPERNMLKPRVSLSGLKGFKVPLISPSFLRSARDNQVRDWGGVWCLKSELQESYVSHCKGLVFPLFDIVNPQCSYTRLHLSNLRFSPKVFGNSGWRESERGECSCKLREQLAIGTAPYVCSLPTIPQQSQGLRPPEANTSGVAGSSLSSSGGQTKTSESLSAGDYCWYQRLEHAPLCLWMPIL